MFRKKVTRHYTSGKSKPQELHAFVLSSDPSKIRLIFYNEGASTTQSISYDVDREILDELLNLK